MGLNSRTKSIAARVCALAKLPKSLQMHFTSQLPVTSGYCTVWQKRGHNAGQEHSYAPTPVVSMSKWISGCYVDFAVEKTFLVAQPMQLVAHTSQEA